MKSITHEEIGNITDAGKLQMYMGSLNEFLTQHKGRKLLVSFLVLPKEKSEALKAYYYKVVVPTFQRALYEAGERLNQEEAMERLLKVSPIARKERFVNDAYVYELKNINEMGVDELIEHIDFLQQYCAENYFAYIADPNEIIK